MLFASPLYIPVFYVQLFYANVADFCLLIASFFIFKDNYFHCVLSKGLTKLFRTVIPLYTLFLFSITQNAHIVEIEYLQRLYSFIFCG